MDGQTRTMMNELMHILQFMATAVWSTLPAFAISIGLAALVQALKLEGAIRRAFSARVGTAVLLATLAGAFSPFCSCTVIPVITGLLLSGVPLAPIMSFWLASPTMDPEIFALSAGILGWPLALTRLAATLALSLAAGYLTLVLSRTPFLQRILPDGRPAQAEETADPHAIPRHSTPVAVSQPMLMATPIAATTAPGGCGATTCRLPAVTQPPGWQKQLTNSFRQIEWPQYIRETGKQSWQLGRWLLLAFLMEALIVRYVPQEAIAAMVGGDNAMAVPLAALAGIPLYLNNISALPIVSGLLAQGMQPGAAIAFLIAGPVTTIPAMTAVWGTVQRRVFALYLGISLLGAIVLGILTNLLLG